MSQFRASHAIALAMMAFAAAGASAQTAGAYTVTTSPDMKVCTVNGVAAGAGVTAFKTGDAGGTYTITKADGDVVTVTSEGIAKANGERIAFARAGTSEVPADGQLRVTMKRSTNGEEPTVVQFSGEMKDGRMVIVTPQGEKVVTLDGKKLEALKAELMEAAVDSKDAKESPKYHVKRPAATAHAGQVIELDRVPAEGLATTKARIMMADGVKLDGAVECRVIVRDKQ